MFGMEWPVLLALPAFILFIAFGLLGSRLAAYRGRDAVLWFLLCAFFPPLVILAVYLKPKIKAKQQIKQCPFCKQFIERSAVVCKHCGRSLRDPQIELTSPDEYDRPFKM